MVPAPVLASRLVCEGCLAERLQNELCTIRHFRVLGTTPGGRESGGKSRVRARVFLERFGAAEEGDK